MTLSITDAQHNNLLYLCHCAECQVLFFVMLSVIMLSVVMLNVDMLSVVEPLKLAEVCLVLGLV